MSRATQGRPNPNGFALIVAILAMALLATMALGLLALSYGHRAGTEAEFTRARLRAAAEAGFFYAVRQLSLEEHERRWSIDGRPHRLRFDGVDLAVAVEDERGKIPLNSIDDDRARAMFAAIGLSGDQLEVVTDSFLDWRDPDDLARTNGAESAYYAPLGRIPRNGPLRSLDELLAIRGMTPDIVARLRPAVTVFGGETQGFDERYAQPFAAQVMGVSPVTILERERELAGERPALALNNADQLVAEPLTIRVTAQDADGGAYTRATVIEFTGSTDQPYLVRAAE